MHEWPPRALGHSGAEQPGVGLRGSPAAMPEGEELAVALLGRLSAHSRLWRVAQLLPQGLACPQPRPHPGIPQQVPLHSQPHACLQKSLSPIPPVNSGFRKCVQPTWSWALLRAPTVAPCRASRWRIRAQAPPRLPPPQASSLAAPRASLLLATPGVAPLRVSLLLPRAAGASLSVKLLQSGAARRAAAPTPVRYQGATTHRARGELWRVVIHVRHGDDGRGCV